MGSFSASRISLPRVVRRAGDALTARRAGLGARLGQVDREFLLLLALGFFAWAPLLSPGYFFNAHDAHHSVFWLVEFDQALRDGAWWPRWAPDHALGYGYPLWVFYSPLSYYVAEAFHLLGMGFTAAVKATYALAFVASGAAMYALARRWWGRSAGLVAGLTYTYAPYHLVDIYVRSAFAEFVAFIWFPWALLAFWDLVEEGGARRLAWAGLTYGLVVLTHSVTGLLFSPFLGLYIAFLLARRARPLLPIGPFLRRLARGALFPALAVALGLGLSAIFWLPLVLERSYIVQEQWLRGQYNYLLQFVYPHQFLSPFWGFGHALAGPADGMSLQIGALPIVLSLWAAARAWRGEVARRDLVGFLAIATLVITFLMTPAARPLWQLVPLGGLVQFPWRMLALTALTTAILAGAAVADGGEGGRRAAWAWALALWIVLASFPYNRPELTPITPRDESPLAVLDFERKHPDMIGSTAWAQPPQDSPLVAQYESGEPLRKAIILSGEGTVEPIRHGGASEEVLVRAATDVRLQFLTYWYPGWRATVDGRPMTIAPEGPHGLITLSVPAGEHRVALRFGDTPGRSLAAVISGLSLLAFLILWARGNAAPSPGAAGRGW